MFGNIGVMELVLILIVALVIFGPGKLPEVGKSLGRSIGEFKDALRKSENTIKDSLNDEGEK
jgi:twin arginine-targeting protein translocase, TatA/E family